MANTKQKKIKALFISLFLSGMIIVPIISNAQTTSTTSTTAIEAQNNATTSGTSTMPTSTQVNLLDPLKNLQVKIPGLEKLLEGNAASCSTYGSETYCSLPWISIYIKAIYNYALGIVGILAALALMIGGVIYLTSLGNATRISEAKSWITGALTGMLIMFTSYILLNEVNPDIINLKPVEIQPVKEIVLMPEADYEAITGETVKAAFGPEMIQAIKDISAQYQVSPCWFVAHFKYESGGHVNAIGPDANVTSGSNFWNYGGTQCKVSSRRKFLYKEAGITTCKTGGACRCDASKKTLKFNPKDPNTLSPEYSWGLGLGQHTIFPDVAHDPDKFFSGHDQYKMVNGKRAFLFRGEWITIAEALTMKGNMKIMALMTKSYYCPKIKYDGSGFEKNCICRYGGMRKNKQTGQYECAVDPSAKVNLYNQCLKNGIDFYLKK